MEEIFKLVGNVTSLILCEDSTYCYYEASRTTPLVIYLMLYIILATPSIYEISFGEFGGLKLSPKLVFNIVMI